MQAQAHHFRTAAALVAAILVVLIFLRACQGPGAKDAERSASAAVAWPNPSAQSPPASLASAPLVKSRSKSAKPCGAGCKSDFLRIAFPASAPAGGEFENFQTEAETPLSLAMALAGDEFDVNGGIMSGAAPPIVLAGGFAFNPGPGGSPPGSGSDPDPTAPGPGDPGPGGDPILPPPIVTPPSIDPAGPDPANPPPMETPIPAALPLFLSALAGIAFASRRKKS